MADRHQKAKDAVDHAFEWTDDLIDAFAFGENGMPTEPVSYPTIQSEVPRMAPQSPPKGETDQNLNQRSKTALKKGGSQLLQSQMTQGTKRTQTAAAGSRLRGPERASVRTAASNNRHHHTTHGGGGAAAAAAAAAAARPPRAASAFGSAVRDEAGPPRPRRPGAAAAQDIIPADAPAPRRSGDTVGLFKTKARAGASASLFETLLKDEETNRLRPKGPAGGGRRKPAARGRDAPPGGGGGGGGKGGGGAAAEAEADMPVQLTMRDRLELAKQQKAEQKRREQAYLRAEAQARAAGAAPPPRAAVGRGGGGGGSAPISRRSSARSRATSGGSSAAVTVRRASLAQTGRNGLRGRAFAGVRFAAPPEGLGPAEREERGRLRALNLEKFLTEVLGDAIPRDDARHPRLPLHYFDNADYDMMTPEEVIARGTAEGYEEAAVDAVAMCTPPPGAGGGEEGPAAAEAGGLWRRCLVTRYHPREDAYEVTWYASLSVQRVPRLLVCRGAEDRFAYVRRVEEAMARRDRCAALLARELAVACMPADAAVIGTLGDAQARRVVAAVAARAAVAAHAAAAAALLEEARAAYEAAMNGLVFDADCLNRANLGAFLRLGLGPRAAPPAVPRRAVAENCGRARYGPAQFAAARARFLGATFLAHPAAIAAAQGARGDALRAAQLRLFPAAIAPEGEGGGDGAAGAGAGRPAAPLRLEQFRRSRADHLARAVHRIKMEWPQDTAYSVKGPLSAPGLDPALYDLDEGRLEVYQSPECRVGRLLRRTNLAVTDTLADLTRASLETYCREVAALTACSVEVKGSAQVEVAWPAGVGGEGEPAPPAPLFRLELRRSEGLSVLNQAALDRAAEEVAEWRKSEEAQEDGARCPVAVPAPVEGHTFEWDVPPGEFAAAVGEAFAAAVGELRDVPRVERAVMERLFWPEARPVAAAAPDTPWVAALRAGLAADCARAVGPLAEFVRAYDRWVEFLNLDVEAYLGGLGHAKNLPGEEGAAEDDATAGTADTADDEERLVAVDVPLLRLTLETHTRERRAVLEQIPAHPVGFGLFQVSARRIRELLGDKHQAVLDRLLALHERCCARLADFVVARFEEVKARLRRQPRNVEDVAAMEEYLSQVPMAVAPLEDKIQEMMEWNQVLDDFGHRVPEAHSRAKWTAFGWPLMAGKVAEQTAERMKEYRATYHEEMVGEQERFAAALELLELEVAGFTEYQDLGMVEKVAAHVEDVRRKLEEADEKARLFNSREGIFQSEITDYEVLSRVKKAFEPYANLWGTTHRWLHSYQAWTQGKFVELDAEALEEEVNQGAQAIAKAYKFFEKTGKGMLASIAEGVKQQIAAFKPAVPLVVALRNPGMRERHWGEISSKLGFKVAPDESTTLEGLLALDLADHIEMIGKVAEAAGKEYQIQQALEKMYAEWDDMLLDIRAYKDTGTGVLGGVDEINAVLDEHVTMTQAMMFSSFKGPFEVDIDEWNRKLYMVSEVLEAWLAVQRNWLYLQPIFESPDINKQLPTEGKKFATVDKNWRQAIAAAKSTPKVIEYCNNEKLLEKFREGAILLDQVQKGLSDYLETKRSVFARLYFLSNDELLSILSESKDVMRVQPHLKKCFEGIDKVNFADELIIDAMVSPEGEKVAFAETIDPKGVNVEAWMLELERMMRVSVRDVMRRAIEDYPGRARPKWMQKWPAMCVLNGSQLWWTRETEQFLAERGADGPQAALDLQLEQLKDMVVLVRGELSKAARTTVGALTVIDVHARDVMIKLVHERVESKADFLWTSQLRYYWDDDLFAEMVAARRPYGYEYLGNSFRLVITPLTDKCYLTLMGALQMILGGAPAGPAGTGKTETTKDLSKALAMQCVVFNCSDGLDYIAMGKFFKGLASCGAWACFDEFNRINIEVLSVIGQQIMTIQLGLKQGKTTLAFEGSNIALSAGFGVFITMNPGYAGRSDLPDSLKALFRPVAMMVPDYALIGEIMFFAYGFEYAKELGAKMVTTFKLCSEQLSAQPHYDYGMRAVKTVITAAGNLKRAEPNTDEFVLLLRALQDVNYPKFLEMDLPLFEGIISDLFPGKSRPELDYGKLNATMKVQIEQRNLQVNGFFVQKVIQLYEMIVVRHGLMLVGPTGGGKSSNLHVLEHTLNSLKKQGVKGFAFEKIKIYQLNPKSITMGQMYGEFDPNTHEWQDGIMSTMYREACQSTTPDRKWVMFNGPVDAIWIENMNTVLDDNKKLCLNSGEIIKMSPEMTMMFEVEDLAVASPATVSRVGVIYMEPRGLGLDVLVQSWLALLPAVLPTECRVTLSLLFDTYLAPACAFLRLYLKELVPTVDNNLAASCMRLLDCYLERYRPKEGVDPPNDKQLKAIKLSIEAYFVFALVWSVGATTTEEGRAKFDGYLRAYMATMGSSWQFPKEGTVYDYVFDIDDGVWRGWMEVVNPVQVNTKESFAELVVPTVDSVRNSYLLHTLLAHGQHCLMVGDTGTGKTVNIAQYLSGKETVRGQVLHANHVPLSLTFSAQTSANMTQDLLDSKMEKRRKGVFGPPSGKRFIVHVDDVNMPKREEYGAQPPIEMLRQWFDQRGWYDRKELGFRRIVDLTFICSMGPPGGGRQDMTARFLRHFNVVGYVNMSKESQGLIFGTILGDFLNNFDGTIQNLKDQIVNSTVAIFHSIKRELLPTPSKIHYTFNLRDLAKVFQGVLMVDPKSISEPEQMARLWVHECVRVFEDRLINEEDHGWFQASLRRLIEEQFRMDWDRVACNERLVYGDYMEPGADPRPYREVPDMAQLQAVMEEYLTDHNAESKAPMPLVMFLDAIEHVSRVARVLRQPQGNALLLGVGGSGRQSMTKLATYISGYDLFQVEIKKGYGVADWREDVRTCLKKAALRERPTTFLFNDAQIVSDVMLEDINNILNSGDVPNLYAQEDMDEILQVCKVDCQRRRLQPTKLNIFNQYIRRVRSNLHVCVCMSPLGTAFRNSLRMFPSLVNCCTIDWFTDWPAEALVAVAESVLGKAENLAEHKGAVVATFQSIHASVQEASEEFWEVLRRRNYVTPTSYLTLLSTFQRLMDYKMDEVQGKKSRLQTGLDMLTKTKGEVDGMKEELTELQPVLVRTTQEVEELMVTLTAEKEQANKKKVVVEAQEEEANAKAAATKEIADDAQRDLDEALPALDAALESLKSLKKADIDEVKALKKPPGGVKLTMEVLCYMFNVKPVKKNDPENPGKKISDFLEAARATFLADAKLMLDMLIQFDKDNIPDKVIRQIDPFITDESLGFTPTLIEKASKACKALCQWAHAMHKYHFVALGVAPKKAKLAEAQTELDKVMAVLNDAKAQLQAVVDKLAELEQGYNDAVAKKEELANKAKKCEVQLANAAKLIGGLGGEEIRWKQTVEDLTVSYVNLVGDVLVSSGTISYLGPFTFDFRTKITSVWHTGLQQRLVPHTPMCDLEKTMGNPVEIRQWNLNDLPTDQLSTQNGIIMSKATRWPLLIDPQGQANRFIKTMGKNADFCENGMDIVKMSDKNFLRGLENGVRFGKWVLMENIGEELDASLEPILLQQKFKQGGQEMMRIGDNTIPYNDSFKFYMTTKLPNPHYAPEVQVKVSLLNFTITEKGLEEQLLNITVQEELPDLAEKKAELVTANAAANKQLYDIESNILHLLSSAEGNILDNTDLIDTLADAKNTSEEIKLQMKESEETEKEIEETSEKYRPVAKRASLLYFCISSLCNVDPMYQYALPWFTQLFIRGIGQAPPSNDLYVRLDNLNNFFTYSLYVNICRSLFERHKLLFSFLLTIKILQGDDLVDPLDWRFLISGMSMSGKPKVDLPNPDPEWITSSTWTEILTLNTLPNFVDFALHFGSRTAKWRQVFDSSTPEVAEFPAPYDGLTGLRRLSILRCLRRDKAMDGVLNFVVETMGQQYVEPPPFDIRGCYNDSAPTSPLVFVLSTGSDPNKDLFTFAGEVGAEVQSIALGQGQGQIALNLVNKGFETGDWILLQNCHLALSWMPELEKLCDDFEPSKMHENFRLWLTSMPSPAFPVLVLQMSVKMTKEPPKGLKANMKSTYIKLTDEELTKTRKPEEFRKLLFGLCFYHALAIERKKFGPLGWNVPYEFNDTDLDISRAQLELYVEEYDEIPYQVLTQLVSVVNYGGRITDDKDMRTSDIILNTFFTPKILEENYTFSKSGTYFSITPDRDAPQKSYLDYIETLPLVPEPEAFGMHENANITCAITDTDENFGIIVSLQPRVSGGVGASREEQIGAIAADLEARLSPLFDVEQTAMRYPTDYHESMNTVLVQEIQRYNNLLEVMVVSLKDVQRALKGQVLLSSELEAMGDNMFNQLVPQNWEAKAYPSLKPLTPWYDDLLRRCKFLADWIEEGIPSVYWISGFFFPQGFMTGIVQNFARKYQLPIDTVSLGYKMMEESAEQLVEKPKDGAYIDGLFLEGARWHKGRKELVDPKPKELFSPMPVIHLQPEQGRQQPKGGIYRCPVYKILTRTGTLSTTGHSTNFVCWIEIPSNKATIWRSSLVSETNAQVKFCDQDYWIKAGVACFCALRY